MNDENLINDARITYEECGFLPSELLKMRNEAKKLLEECVIELKRKTALLQCADLIIHELNK